DRLLSICFVLIRSPDNHLRWLSKDRPSLASRYSPQDGDYAQRQQQPVRAMKPGEGDARPFDGPTMKAPVQNERLDDEQDEDEQQPQTEHGVHPPERGRQESIPEVEPPRHVETGEADNEDRSSRLPDEAALYCLKRLQP